MRLVELSHVIGDGTITYPGLPAPIVADHLSFEDSHDHYEEGTEFRIARIEMVANTGTYLDAPAHRHRHGVDLGGLELERCAELDGVVVDANPEGPIGPEVLDGVHLGGRAVLFRTGHDRYWGTPRYAERHPHLGPVTVERLIEEEPVLVGIDSLNIDDTADGTRIAHTSLLGAGIPLVEHLTGLDQLPTSGFRFTSAPVRFSGVATFPVRAYAVVP